MIISHKSTMNQSAKAWWNKTRGVQWSPNTAERRCCLYLNFINVFWRRTRTRTLLIHKMKETRCNNINRFQSLTFVKKSFIIDVAVVLVLPIWKARRVNRTIVFKHNIKKQTNHRFYMRSVNPSSVSKLKLRWT